MFRMASCCCHPHTNLRQWKVSNLPDIVFLCASTHPWGKLEAFGTHPWEAVSIGNTLAKLMVGAYGSAESCHKLGQLGAWASYFLNKFAITPSNFLSSLCDVHMTCEMSLKHCDSNYDAKVRIGLGQ